MGPSVKPSEAAAPAGRAEGLEPPVDLGLRDGDHACILFASDEEHRRVVGQFLAEGLLQGQRVLNIVAQHSPTEMRRRIRAGGAEPSTCEARGQLSILQAQDAYLPDGQFDPDRMTRMLSTTVHEALASGWHGMRGSGDMSWSLGGAPGSDRILEYEAKLNLTIPGSRFRALCQYDMRLFSPEVLLQVLMTHPVAFVGTERLENFYYTPPEEHLGDPRPEAQLQRWLTNLRQRQSREAQDRARIRAEETLRRTHHELAAKTTFLNAAAHELATPLTPLRLQIRVLREADPGTPLASHERSLAILERGFTRLSGLVGQLLESVRADSAALRVEPRPIDLCAVVASSVQAFEDPAATAGVELRSECHAPAMAHVDPERIGQVLDNLLANALKFTPGRGVVTARVRPSDGGWLVSVQDTGLGIAPDRIEDLFQPFSQVHDPVQVVRAGAGLGLHISKSIIARHGGRIWAHSPGPGHGAEFSFWVPGSDGQQAVGKAP